MPSPENYDYSMMVNDLELVNSLIKTVVISDNGLGEKRTNVSIIHIDGLEYMDVETDYNGPIMKAKIFRSGGNRAACMENFKDRTDTYHFGMIKTIFKHYYSKDGGKTWKPTCKNGFNKVTNYA